MGASINDLCHLIGGCEDRTYALVRDIVLGLMSVSNATALSNDMQRWKTSVKQYVLACSFVLNEPPSVDDTHYRHAMLSLFLKDDTRANEKKALLDSLPNGSWTENGKIPIHRSGVFANRDSSDE